MDLQFITFTVGMMRYLVIVKKITFLKPCPAVMTINEKIRNFSPRMPVCLINAMPSMIFKLIPHVRVHVGVSIPKKEARVHS